MDEYKEAYLILWVGVADALKEAERLNCKAVKAILFKAQQDAEEAYISQDAGDVTELVE